MQGRVHRGDGANLMFIFCTTLQLATRSPEYKSVDPPMQCRSISDTSAVVKYKILLYHLLSLRRIAESGGIYPSTVLLIL